MPRLTGPSRNHERGARPSRGFRALVVLALAAGLSLTAPRGSNAQWVASAARLYTADGYGFANSISDNIIVGAGAYRSGVGAVGIYWYWNGFVWTPYPLDAPHDCLPTAVDTGSDGDMEPVGTYWDAEGNPKACAWRFGLQFFSLNPPNVPFSTVNAVDQHTEAGWIAMDSLGIHQAYLFNGDLVGTNLHPNGALWSEATGVWLSAPGGYEQVVGNYVTEWFTTIPCLWNKVGNGFVFQPLELGPYAWASSTCGTFQGGYFNTDNGTCHACLWFGGVGTRRDMHPDWQLFGAQNSVISDVEPGVQCGFVSFFRNGVYWEEPVVWWGSKETAYSLIRDTPQWWNGSSHESAKGGRAMSVNNNVVVGNVDYPSRNHVPIVWSLRPRGLKAGIGTGQ